MEFDEINKLEATERRSVPYQEYFGDMELSEEQKQERIGFAEKLEDIIILIFSMIEVMRVYKTYTPAVIIAKFTRDYEALCNEYEILDDYMMLYITAMVEQMVNVSIENQEKEYYLSTDRAMFISENEANTTLNYKDFQKAIKEGKTKKQWIDIRDKRERKSHIAVGRKTIDIDKPFKVGNSLMLFPKDTSYNASDREIVNCRCTIKYL